MASSSQQINSNALEELKKEKEKLEKQRLAILNILEDAQVGQKELQERYRDLNIIKTLTYELSVSLDVVAVIEKVIRAARQILPEETNYFYCVTPVDFSSPQFCACFIYAQIGVGDAYFNRIKESIKIFLKTYLIRFYKKKRQLNRCVKQLVLRLWEGFIKVQSQQNRFLWKAFLLL